MDSFSKIIGLWASAEECGRDIGEAGVTVRAWRNRNSIPADRWNAIVAAAAKRGFHGVTLEVLADLAAKTSRSGAGEAA